MSVRMAMMTKAAPPIMVKIEAIPCTAMPVAATGSRAAGVGNHAAASVHLPRLFCAALARSLARNLLLPKFFERSNLTRDTALHISAKLAFLRRSDDVR